jgi:hypothetical protein
LPSEIKYHFLTFFFELIIILFILTDGRGEKALGTGDEGYVEDINEDEDVTEFTPRPDEYDKIMPVFKKWETELRRFQHWT